MEDIYIRRPECFPDTRDAKLEEDESGECQEEDEPPGEIAAIVRGKILVDGVEGEGFCRFEEGGKDKGPEEPPAYREEPAQKGHEGFVVHFEDTGLR